MRYLQLILGLLLTVLSSVVAGEVIVIVPTPSPPAPRAILLEPISLGLSEEQDRGDDFPFPPEGKKGTPGESLERKETQSVLFPKDGAKDEDKNPWYTAHIQATTVSQGYFPFRAPYTGPISLPPDFEFRHTATTTLYLAFKLWQGGSIIVDPEMAGGTGIGSTQGIAGFPNGEATRVGNIQPTPYFARFMYQQVFELGGEWEQLTDSPNQLPVKQYKNNIIFKIGKMPATDDFDDNRYAHDPRTQFLNWGLMFNPAWDYPANTRGYTYGGTLEMNYLDWSFRYGIFAEPSVANGAPLDPHLLKAHGQVVEFEQRYTILGDRPGGVKLLGYLNNAHMGDYGLALQQMPINPDITQTRAYRIKFGFGLNWEQEIMRDLGVFGRLGWDDGHTETWAYTQVDRTASLGMVLKGREWGRPSDSIGVAGLLNGLALPQRSYLAAGGIGFIVGDGQLNYGIEEISEIYYSLQLRKNIYCTFDYQHVNNPAYNRDRGPVDILAIRVHTDF